MPCEYKQCGTVEKPYRSSVSTYKIDSGKPCTPELLDTVATLAPERIVYVSCDPATLARDCAILEEKGYKVKEITPFDLFPHTAHVETAVLITRNM